MADPAPIAAPMASAAAMKSRNRAEWGRVIAAKLTLADVLVLYKTGCERTKDRRSTSNRRDITWTRHARLLPRQRLDGPDQDRVIEVAVAAADGGIHQVLGGRGIRRRPGRPDANLLRRRRATRPRLARSGRFRRF